jgi:WD40 repeat protein
MRRRLVLISVFGLSLLATRVLGQTAYPFSPANYIGGDPHVLRIFPPTGAAIQVPLPFALGRVAFGSDGKALYVARDRLLKIEFNPVRMSTVPGTEGFDTSGLAVSQRQDMILISGAHTQDHRRVCGLFEVKTLDGSLRQVLTSSGCDYVSAWTEISLSPAAEQAVALHNRRFEMIDLVRATTRPLDANFWAAEWSPDGKWIAALAGEESQLWLVDPSDLSRRRDLGKTGGGVHWSPDSRYLLLFADSLLCNIEDRYSMETLEVASGKRSVVKSSRCQIVGAASGWMSADIAR